MPVITNIAAYKFTTLRELKPLRERLIALCKAWDLKGTIVLSPEGINLFVAGAAAEIDRLLAELRSIPGLGELSPKFSESTDQPFSRMLVRLKKEIIAFGIDGINPAQQSSPKLAARTLHQWLNEGRPVTLLDTRNNYEIKLGTFKGAIPIGVDRFRDFPEAVKRLPEEMKHQPIVMFCTGGIRCEKAGPFMERAGFQHIFQLDGGILKYFEECGEDHYEGECFVFDHRVGVDPGLNETASALCYHCLTPLTAEDQQDPRYVAATSCSYCFRTSAEQMAGNIAQRHAALRQATTPLPGSQAYDNFRPVTVPVEFDGATVVDFLCGILGHISREEWRTRCDQGLLRKAHHETVSATHRVRAGERYHHLLPALREPAVNADIRILHEDEAIFVLDKPAPLPMHPGGRFNRNSLQFILQQVYHPQKPRPAHRLDANTTGLVVCTRTRHFAGLLQPQFARNEVEKTYLARVQGHSAQDFFISEAPIGSEPLEAGARDIDSENGLTARTEFCVRKRLADGTSLLEVHPHTGRTNQIRVHLWQLGLPVCGDPLYLSAHQRGTPPTLSLQNPPLCLHAWKLSFQHPLTRERVVFEAEMPKWAR